MPGVFVKEYKRLEGQYKGRFAGACIRRLSKTACAGCDGLEPFAYNIRLRIQSTYRPHIGERKTLSVESYIDTTKFARA
jgi:hypothetical protein